jgi:purine-nucleoside phosphorylase
VEKRVVAATAEVRRHWSTTPKVALVLGTGLGQLAEQIAVEATIPFGEIPGFARATAIAHRGQIVCGRLCDVPVILLDGRCHVYEGYSLDDVTLPIRVLESCGTSTLFVTNASGGVNQFYRPGDIMVIEDHLDLMGGRGRQSVGHASPPRPQRTSPTPYDPELIELALQASRRHNFVAHRGVYAAVTGPNYETRAEYAMLRSIGADVVGMSTVPEVQVARQLGMRVMGISIVTNVAHVETPEAVDAWHVVSAAQQAEPAVRRLVEDVIRQL